APEGGVHVTGRVPSTASLAVAVNVSLLPNGSVVVSVMLDGRVSTGPCVSTTITLNEAVEGLGPSLALQLTSVVPSGKTEALGGLQLTVTSPATASCAVTV